SAGVDGRIKARFGRRECEEIALNEAAPEVAGQLGAERHQPFRMPFDHSFQRLDDKKARRLSGAPTPPWPCSRAPAPPRRRQVHARKVPPAPAGPKRSPMP